MSVGILALKVGVVATVTGVSVATPILLKRSSGVSSEPVTSNVVSDTGSEREGAGGQRVQATEETLSRSSLTTSEEAHPSVVVTESFDKKCFIIPARSSDGVELLTCYEDKKIREDAEAHEEEYDSIFHIYDRSKKSVPVEVSGKLLWEPEKSQVSVQVTEDVGAEVVDYTFKSEGKGWEGVSTQNSQMDLLEQCAVYEITLKDSDNHGTYWLSCGDDNSVFNAQNPTSIPLTAWQKNQ